MFLDFLSILRPTYVKVVTAALECALDTDAPHGARLLTFAPRIDKADLAAQEVETAYREIAHLTLSRG